MTEATVGDGARSVNGNATPFPQLRGLPRGLYCRAADVMEWMKWSRETWNEWRNEGMRTDYPGTKAEHVLTDWVIDFLCEYGKGKKG